jgi:hypothetical protein
LLGADNPVGPVSADKADESGQGEFDSQSRLNVIAVERDCQDRTEDSAMQYLAFLERPIQRAAGLMPPIGHFVL